MNSLGIRPRESAEIVLFSDTGNRGKVNLQVVIDMNPDRVVEGILGGERVSLEKVNRCGLFVGIDDPIFTHAVALIIVCFVYVIMGGSFGRGNFNNKIRCTIAALAVQFVPGREQLVKS